MAFTTEMKQEFLKEFPERTEVLYDARDLEKTADGLFLGIEDDDVIVVAFTESYQRRHAVSDAENEGERWKFIKADGTPFYLRHGTIEDL